MLYTALFPNLIKYIHQIVRDILMAEDIVQETFIKLWDDRLKIMVTGSIKAYIFRMAHNLSVNKLQQAITARNKVNRVITEEEWQFIKDTYQVNDFIIEKIESDDTDILIKNVINSLPGKCREVFILSRYEYLNNEEIAERLDISVNTVRAHIYHALEVIRQSINAG